MSRTFDGSTSNYLSAARAAATGYPLTLAAWCRPSQSLLSKGYAISLARSATTNDIFGIYAVYDLGLGFRGGFQVRQSTTLGDATGTYLGGSPTYPWMLVIGVGSSATSRTAYYAMLGDLDFISGSNATNLTPASIDMTLMGAGKNGLTGAIVSPFNGLVAACAVWDVELDALDRLRLLRGEAFENVRPGSIKSLYRPSYGLSVEWDKSPNRVDLAMTGTVLFSADDPMYPIRIPSFHKVMPTDLVSKFVQLGPIRRTAFSHRDPMRGPLELQSPAEPPSDQFVDDTEGATDTLGLVATYNRSVDDNEGLTDPVDVTNVFSRVLAEAEGLSDSASQAVGYRRTFANSEGLSDALSRTATYARTLAQALGLTDTRARVVGFVRVQDDSEPITDTLQQGAIVILSEGVGLSDSLSRVSSFFFTKAEAQGILDEVIRVLDYSRSADDSLGIVDAVSVFRTIVAVLAESIGIFSSLSRMLQIHRVFQGAIGDTVGTSDDAAAFREYVRAVTDAEGLTDLRSFVASFVFQKSEAMGLADVRSGQTSFVRAMSDNEGLVDALVPLVMYMKSIAEAVGLTDAEDVLRIYQRSVTDALGLTDQASRVATFIRALSDSEDLADALGGGALYSLIQNESVALSDAMSRVIAFVRTAAEHVALTDVITRSATFARELAAAEGLTDDQLGQLNRDLVALLFRLSIGEVLTTEVSHSGMFDCRLRGTEVLTGEVS